MLEFLGFVAYVFSSFLVLFAGIEVDPGITVGHCIFFVVALALFLRFLLGKSEGGAFNSSSDNYIPKHAKKSYTPRHGKE